MTNRPRISVVLPVFNGAKFIRQSLESVLDQSFADFELIVFDDGSTDETPSIVQEYRDPRVRCLSNGQNLGLFPTLNRAINASNGELIKLWSQDDVMKANCLSVSTEFMTKNREVVMAYSAFDEIDTVGEIVRVAPSDETPDVIEPGLAAQLMFYHGSIPGNIANVVIRREALNECGYFREDLIASGDFEMWVRLSGEHPIGFISTPLINLRIHKAQFSRRRGMDRQFIQEDNPIFATLFERLPASLKSHALKYDLRHRRLQHMHYLIKHLLIGHLEEARQLFAELRRSGDLGKLFLLWVLTCNQRFGRMTPRYELKLS